MKKFLLFFAALALLSFTLNDITITKKEKKFATKFLKQTKEGVSEAIKGLSDAQLKYKPAADKWGVEECLKHIAITEQMLWGMLEANLKQPATPDKRTEVKMTDEDVIKNIENRSTKVKTMDPAKPENTPFKSATDALTSFQESRDKLKSYVKNTEEDLRNHIVTMPFGSLDGYQFILFISAHTNRHTQQINEVKADPGFPKN